MIRHSFVRSSVVLAAALAFAACGDDDDNGTGPDGNDLGSLTATVTGDVSETFTGEGFFAASDDGSWGIYMGGEDDGDSAIWFWGEGDRPGTGTITLTSDGENGGWYVHGGSESFFWAESGTLTITTSNDNRVAGSFDFTGSDMAGGEVTVEGTFSAPNWTDELQ